MPSICKSLCLTSSSPRGGGGRVEGKERRGGKKGEKRRRLTPARCLLTSTPANGASMATHKIHRYNIKENYSITNCSIAKTSL